METWRMNGSLLRQIETTVGAMTKQLRNAELDTQILCKIWGVANEK
jgi:hypothetical protein